MLVTDKALKFGTVQPSCRDLHDQHRAWRQGLAADLRQARETRQWGIPYQADLEIGRTPMSAGKTKAPVETMTISIDDTPAGATLRIEWGGTSATAPFTVG